MKVLFTILIVLAILILLIMIARFIYVVVKRIEDHKNEDFEKRDY